MSKKPYKCPLCPRKALTRPKMMIHLWAEGLAGELDLPFEEVEATLKKNYARGLVRVDSRSGDLIGAWSKMGAFGAKVQEAKKRIEEEQRKEREARRQARREALALEQEEEAAS
jgi:hypothetical protein